MVPFHRHHTGTKRQHGRSDSCGMSNSQEKGIPISCDLNYRKKLWSREKAGKVMGELMPYVDLLTQ